MRTLPLILLAIVIGLHPDPLHAAPDASLAQLVPADARIYVEIRDWNRLLSSPVGSALGEVVQGLTPPSAAGMVAHTSSTHPAASREAAVPSTWRDRLMDQVGLVQPGIIDLLTTGRLTIVADGWRSLGDAVMIAQPLDIARIETLLHGQLILPITAAAQPGSRPARVMRCYRLANDHALASDGSAILIGRQGTPGGLFARTIALWSSDHGVALSDTADYRDRTAPLQPNPQILLYASGKSRMGAGSALPTLLWPSAWNQYQSIAASLFMSFSGAVLDVSAAPSTRPTVAPRPDPPLLAKLPASTLLAWTQRIDYAGEYRRLTGPQKDGTVAFYQEVLEAGLARGSMDQQLLSHLSGDTLFVLSQVAKPGTRPSDGENVLWVPALTLAVQADNTHLVGATFLCAVNNLLSLSNVHPPASGPLRVENVPIGPGGGAVASVPVGKLLTNTPGGEVLGQLQLSWSLADGFLVIGTAAESVRELVLARRGQAPLLAHDPLVASGSRMTPQTVLLAQPLLISELLSSWAGFLDASQTTPARGQASAAAPQSAPGGALRTIEAVPIPPNWWAQLRPSRAVSPGSAMTNLGPEEFLQRASRVLRLFTSARYLVATSPSSGLTARLELRFARPADARPTAAPR